LEIVGSSCAGAVRAGLFPVFFIYGTLTSVCGSYSFAPSGLVLFPLSTHGLRRGLHSFAASRLD
jgi:hypothetical protein